MKKMCYVIIEWSPAILHSKIKSYDDCKLDKRGFYILLTSMYDKQLRKYVNRKLQYIGLACHQTIRKRIQQTHDKADDKISRYLSENPGYKLLAQPGIIIESSYEKKYDALYKDIEALLIFDNRPRANTLLKDSQDSYSGRNIIIVNEREDELIKKFSYHYT